MSDDNTCRIFNTSYDTRAYHLAKKKRIALESVNMSPGIEIS